MMFKVFHKFNSKRVAFGIVTTACYVNSTLAVVTQQGPPDHVTTPGVEQFGVNPDGVVALTLFDQNNMQVGVGGPSGFLLATGQHIMFAAHTAQSEAMINGKIQFRFDLEHGSLPPFTVPVSQVKIHEFAGTLATQGFDIAVVDLGIDVNTIAAIQGDHVDGYEILPRVDKDRNIEGDELRLSGYGWQGDAEFGITPAVLPGQEKVLGKNIASAIGLIRPDLINEFTMVFWDFDDAVNPNTDFFEDGHNPVRHGGCSAGVVETESRLAPGAGIGHDGAHGRADEHDP